jgi:hypothetical protein
MIKPGLSRQDMKTIQQSMTRDWSNFMDYGDDRSLHSWLLKILIHQQHQGPKINAERCRFLLQHLAQSTEASLGTDRTT